MESPRPCLWLSALATVLSLVIGIPATWFYGLSGAIWDINLSDLLSWMFLVWILRRKMAGDSLGIERFAGWRFTQKPAVVEEVSE